LATAASITCRGKKTRMSLASESTPQAVATARNGSMGLSSRGSLSKISSTRKAFGSLSLGSAPGAALG
jgi:hypothetical protein